MYARSQLLIALCGLVWEGCFLICRANDLEDPFEHPAARLAEKINKLARNDRRGSTPLSVSIDEIRPPARFKSHTTTGLEDLLKRKLKAVGLNVKTLNGELAISGRANLTDDGAILEITITKPDGTIAKEEVTGPRGHRRDLNSSRPDAADVAKGEPNNRPKLDSDEAPPPISFSLPLKDPLTIGKLVAATTDLERIITTNKRSVKADDILETMNEATSTGRLVRVGAVENGYLRASDESPFYVGVLVDGRLQPLLREEGQAIVELPEDARYRVVLSNAAKYKAAFAVEIDGVSTYALSTLRNEFDPAKPMYSSWLVPPGKFHTIYGWHISNKRVQEFRVTSDENEMVSKELGVTGDTGTIRVSVAAAWPVSANRYFYQPDDELHLLKLTNPEAYEAAREQSHQRTEAVRRTGRRQHASNRAGHW